jgi:very-short-patch-repair endonuclease
MSDDRELDRDLDLELVLDRGVDLDLELELDLDRGGDRDLDLELDLDRGVDLDRDRDRGQRSSRRGERGADAVTPAQRGKSRPRADGRTARNEIPASARVARVARVAGAQRGAVSRRQLEQAGLQSNAIDRRAANGTLHRLHRGVYLLGHDALAPLARETAAILVCGDGAVISHMSAAGMWSMIPPEAVGTDVHVTLVGRRKLRSRAGLRIHRAARVEVRRRGGIPLTSPAQTLLDMAADRSRHLEQAFAEAHGRRLLRRGELEAFIERSKGRVGVLALRGLTEAYATGYTRSGAERAMRRLARLAGLPPPEVNAQLHGFEVDFLWRRERLIVEVDGFGFHGHRRAFENDRKRDAIHVAAGYRVIRVTWMQLTHEPLVVVARVAGALAA